MKAWWRGFAVSAAVSAGIIAVSYLWNWHITGVIDGVVATGHPTTAVVVATKREIRWFSLGTAAYNATVAFEDQGQSRTAVLRRPGNMNALLHKGDVVDVFVDPSQPSRVATRDGLIAGQRGIDIASSAWYLGVVIAAITAVNFILELRKRRRLGDEASPRAGHMED
ncbi:hypothetical protein [Dactylosporangium sp. NPDC048998]|uniref:hypothetical protein n=1 Tax=Dactylosporangium sp. NPDC048998 TaxID=3363976 RepID=UPI00371A095A